MRPGVADVAGPQATDPRGPAVKREQATMPVHASTLVTRGKDDLPHQLTRSCARGCLVVVGVFRAARALPSSSCEAFSCLARSLLADEQEVARVEIDVNVVEPGRCTSPASYAAAARTNRSNRVRKSAVAGRSSGRRGRAIRAP